MSHDREALKTHYDDDDAEFNMGYYGYGDSASQRWLSAYS